MKIMLDTNILMSTILFENGPIWGIINKLANKHKIVLCSFVVNELHDVVNRRFPQKKAAAKKFLLDLPFEFVFTPLIIEENLFEISDTDEYPVIYTALKENVNVVITETDVTFHENSDDGKEQKKEQKFPEVLKPLAFLERQWE